MTLYVSRLSSAHGVRYPDDAKSLVMALSGLDSSRAMTAITRRSRDSIAHKEILDMASGSHGKTRPEVGIV
jgi:hypothetical protein